MCPADIGGATIFFLTVADRILIVFCFFFFWFLPSYIGCDSVSSFYWVLMCFTGFYWVVLGSATSLKLGVLPSFTGFYCVLLGSYVFYWFLLGYIGVLSSISGFTGLYCVQQQA